MHLWGPEPTIPTCKGNKIKPNSKLTVLVAYDTLILRLNDTFSAAEVINYRIVWKDGYGCARTMNDEGSRMHLGKVGVLPPDYKALHPRRLSCTHSLP
jgi:hypothetical protein